MTTTDRTLATQEHRIAVRGVLKLIAAMLALFAVAYCVRLGATFWWHSEPTKTQQQCPDGTWYDWPSTVSMERLQAACYGHMGPNPNNGR